MTTYTLSNGRGDFLCCDSVGPYVTASRDGACRFDSARQAKNWLVKYAKSYACEFSVHSVQTFVRKIDMEEVV